jgi:hypothetical protein
VLLAGAVLLGTGCGQQPRSTTPPDEAAAPAPRGEPWALAATRLKKETDFTTCKSVLIGLRSDTAADGAKKLPGMSAEALAALSALVPLSSADVEQIKGGQLTDVDASYLADCFYLRDAARSLALTGLPEQRQAELAFEWVCRQVYLYPWLLGPNGRTFETTALPPTAVLRRGSGSGLERMYVFLALLQQLGLDGCLIGGPTPGSSRSAVVVPFSNSPDPLTDKRKAEAAQLAEAVAAAPRGPFWAVGVRVGTDVRLFDPWRGRSFPVTLAQLRTNPDAARGWFEDKANQSGATLDDAKKATAFLAVPVNALSARMAAFDKHMRTALGVKVAVDPAALRAAFPDPKPAFWNPPDDPLAYGRASRSYLPVDLGGADPTPFVPGGALRFYDLSLRAQIPNVELTADLAMQRFLSEVPSVRDRLDGVARGALALAFIEQPNPRERIQRGQFQEVARHIVSMQNQFAAGAERMRLTKDADPLIRAWLERARELHQALRRAQTISRDKQAEAEALAEFDKHWKDPAILFFVERATVEVGLAETAYLLALCKHEEAERAQVRMERAVPEEAAHMKPEVTAAWQTALSAWQAYEPCASAHAGFPGRAAHAKALMARATRFAEADAKK